MKVEESDDWLFILEKGCFESKTGTICLRIPHWKLHFRCKSLSLIVIAEGCLQVFEAYQLDALQWPIHHVSSSSILSTLLTYTVVSESG